MQYMSSCHLRNKPEISNKFGQYGIYGFGYSVDPFLL